VSALEDAVAFNGALQNVQVYFTLLAKKNCIVKFARVIQNIWQ